MNQLAPPPTGNATAARAAVWLAVLLLGTAAVFALARADIWGERGSGLSPVFAYDLDEYQKVDARLLGYRLVETIALRHERPRAVAAGRGDVLFVAGDESIDEYVAGRPGRRIAVGGAPRALAVAMGERPEETTIYVALVDRVEVFSDGGQRKASWAAQAGKHLFTSIAASDDAVFVASAGQRAVLRYDLAGTLVGKIGQKDADRGIPGFVIPSPYFDVAVAADGLLRVANPGMHRIEAYTAEGDLEAHWGTPGIGIEGFCGCCNPCNFALLGDGRFVTAEKGIPRVKVYSAEGKLLSVVAGPEQLLAAAGQAEETRTDHKLKVFDVAVDGRGRVLVLDPTGRQLLVFEETAAAAVATRGMTQ